MNGSLFQTDVGTQVYAGTLIQLGCLLQDHTHHATWDTHVLAIVLFNHQQIKTNILEKNRTLQCSARINGEKEMGRWRFGGRGRIIYYVLTSFKWCAWVHALVVSISL